MHKITDIDATEKTGNCSVCGFTKIKIRKQRRKSGKLIVECPTVTKRNRRDVSKFFNLLSDLEKTKYSTIKSCECCGSKFNKARIDHDHKTGKFRGFLCHSCNVGLGFFGDSIKKLQSAIRYLQKKSHAR